MEREDDIDDYLTNFETKILKLQGNMINIIAKETKKENLNAQNTNKEVTKMKNTFINSLDELVNKIKNDDQIEKIEKIKKLQLLISKIDNTKEKYENSIESEKLTEHLRKLSIKHVDLNNGINKEIEALKYKVTCTLNLENNPIFNLANNKMYLDQRIFKEDIDLYRNMLIGNEVEKRKIDLNRKSTYLNLGFYSKSDLKIEFWNSHHLNIKTLVFNKLCDFLRNYMNLNSNESSKDEIIKEIKIIEEKLNLSKERNIDLLEHSKAFLTSEEIVDNKIFDYLYKEIDEENGFSQIFNPSSKIYSKYNDCIDKLNLGFNISNALKNISINRFEKHPTFSNINRYVIYYERMMFEYLQTENKDLQTSSTFENAFRRNDFYLENTVQNEGVISNDIDFSKYIASFKEIQEKNIADFSKNKNLINFKVNTILLKALKDYQEKLWNIILEL